MDKISSTAEEIRDFALALRAAEVDDGEDHLEHHGVQGMKWGVRSQETLRKYGLLKGTKKGMAKALGKLEKAANARMKGAGKAVGSAVSGAASAAASKAGSSAKAFKDKKIAEAKAKKEARLEEVRQKKLTKAEIKAQRKELGMSKMQYDKLREETLKSHDPAKVAKGMHTLTDKELADKINRLRAEGQISAMASDRAKARDMQRTLKYNAIKNHPLYKILEEPAKQVAKGVIVNQLYENGFGPVLKQRVERARNDAMGIGKEPPSGFPLIDSRVDNAYSMKSPNSGASRSNMKAPSEGIRTELGKRGPVLDSGMKPPSDLDDVFARSGVRSSRRGIRTELGKRGPVLDGGMKPPSDLDDVFARSGVKPSRRGIRTELGKRGPVLDSGMKSPSTSKGFERARDSEGTVVIPKVTPKAVVSTSSLKREIPASAWNAPAPKTWSVQASPKSEPKSWSVQASPKSEPKLWKADIPVSAKTWETKISVSPKPQGRTKAIYWSPEKMGLTPKKETVVEPTPVTGGKSGKKKNKK